MVLFGNSLSNTIWGLGGAEGSVFGCFFGFGIGFGYGYRFGYVGLGPSGHTKRGLVKV